MKHNVDDLNQAQKNKALRIVNLANVIMTFAKEKLHVNLQRSDIAVAFRIACKKDLGQRNDKLIILKLTTEGPKKAMYQARVKLPQLHPPVFLNEDLIPKREDLALKAWVAVKDNKIHSTWTMDGDIYIKTSPVARSVRVLTHMQLTKIAGADLVQCAPSIVEGWF